MSITRDIEKHPRTGTATGSHGTHDHVGHSGSMEHLQGNSGSYAHRRFGNPAPLGLLSFASTTLLLSFYVIRARGVVQANLIVAMSLAFGGLVQLLAGMWEFARGNTFGATAFSSYGAFYISIALIFIPGFGILNAYAGDSANQLNDALGLYLVSWFIFTFIMFLGSHKSSVMLTVMFFLFMMSFLLSMVGQFVDKISVVKAGGAFGIATAAVAYYLGAADLWTRDSSYVQLPIMPLSRRDATTERV